MEFPKVLVCSPQHESKDYCFDEWVERVKNLTYPNYEVLLADNSETREYCKKIESHGIKTIYIRDKGKGIINKMAEAHESCRKYALRNNFDYMLHLETDVIPPFDVIERLMSHKKNVISATYDIMQGKERKAMIMIDEKSHRFVRGYRTNKYIEQEEPLFFDGKVKRVFHAGIGCILIKSNVLEKFEFRSVKELDYHPDSHFANDLYQQNISIYVDPTINCKHLNSTWLTFIDKL